MFVFIKQHIRKGNFRDTSFSGCLTWLTLFVTFRSFTRSWSQIRTLGLCCSTVNFFPLTCKFVTFGWEMSRITNLLESTRCQGTTGASCWSLFYFSNIEHRLPRKKTHTQLQIIPGNRLFHMTLGHSTRVFKMIPTSKWTEKGLICVPRVNQAQWTSVTRFPANLSKGLSEAVLATQANIIRSRMRSRNPTQTSLIKKLRVLHHLNKRRRFYHVAGLEI